MTLPLGLTCPEGDKVQYRTFPPLALPSALPPPELQQGSQALEQGATVTGSLEGPFLSTLGDGLWTVGLARRRGVRQPGHRWGLPNA